MDSAHLKAPITNRLLGRRDADGVNTVILRFVVFTSDLFIINYRHLYY
jgi:hypothetical protein